MTRGIGVSSSKKRARDAALRCINAPVLKLMNKFLSVTGDPPGKKKRPWIKSPGIFQVT